METYLIVCVVAVCILLCIIKVVQINTAPETKSKYKSKYKGNEFTKQRRRNGKREVYHQETESWLDYGTVRVLLIDNEFDSNYTSLDSLEELEHSKIVSERATREVEDIYRGKVSEYISNTNTDSEYSPSYPNSDSSYSSSGSSYSSSSSSSYDSGSSSSSSCNSSDSGGF